MSWSPQHDVPHITECFQSREPDHLPLGGQEVEVDDAPLLADVLREAVHGDGRGPAAVPQRPQPRHGVLRQAEGVLGHGGHPARHPAQRREPVLQGADTCTL